MPRERPSDGELVESEGVNAGPPVDESEQPPAGRAQPPTQPPPAGPPDPRAVPHDPDDPPTGQGQGELLSSPGSENGISRPGPGQEMSAGEG